MCFGRLRRHIAGKSQSTSHEALTIVFVTRGFLLHVQALPDPGVEVSEGCGEVVVHLAGRPRIKLFCARVAHLAHASR